MPNVNQIKESDWKIFKKLQPIAQQRYYQKAIEGCKKICEEDSEYALDRFDKLRKYAGEQNKEAYPFVHDFRRSTATLCATYMFTRGLLNEDELTQFSEQMQEHLKSALENA